MYDEQQCSTVTEKKCYTYNDKQCSTINEKKCEAYLDQACKTVPTTECKPVTDTECKTLHEQKCSTITEKACHTAFDSITEEQCSTAIEKKCTTHVKSICTAVAVHTQVLGGVVGTTVGHVGGVIGATPAIGFGGFGRHKRSPHGYVILFDCYTIYWELNNYLNSIYLNFAYIKSYLLKTCTILSICASNFMH